MAVCIYGAQGKYGDIMGDAACTSGKDAIGDVLDPETGEVAFVMHSCPDCMAHQAYSDWYKSEYGVRPRWMTREQCIEAYWKLPGVGERA